MKKWIKIEDEFPGLPNVYDVKLTKETMDWLQTDEEITWAVYDINKKQFYLPGGAIRYYIEVTEWRVKNMTDGEKKHDIQVARNLIQTVAEDTDDDLWAKEELMAALFELEKWFEEYEI